MVNGLENLIPEDSKLESLANFVHRKTNRGKRLGYKLDNPRSLNGDCKNNCHRVTNGYILLLKEKLEICADYAEKRVRLYIYNTLLNDKICSHKDNDDIIGSYEILYGRYLSPGVERHLKSTELSIFNEIEDAYFLFSNPILNGLLEMDTGVRSEPFISVEGSVTETIKNHRKKLRADILNERVCGDDIHRDYIVEFTEMTPWNIL